jgi:quercetin dioxygenase-like cupin family protein
VTYRVADAGEVEAWRGVMRRMRRALGIESFGVNQLELPPNSGGHPAHDESKTNHDELYICVGGGGEMTVDGDRVELMPGRYVYVEPVSRRQIVAGDAGIRVIVVGVPAAAKRGGWDEL